MARVKLYLTTREFIRQGKTIFVKKEKRERESERTWVREKGLGTWRGWGERDIKHSGGLFDFNDAMWDVVRDAVGIVCFCGGAWIIGTWAQRCTVMSVFWDYAKESTLRFVVQSDVVWLSLRACQVKQVVLTDDNPIRMEIRFVWLFARFSLVQDVSLDVIPGI